MSVHAKKTIRDVKPYTQGKAGTAGNPAPIKLSSNELPYPPSPGAVAAFHQVEPDIGRYPDGGQQALRNAIADLHRVPASNIFAGNGSEEAIGLMVRAILNPGDQILVSGNSFVMTEIYARSVGAEIITCPETNHIVDVDAFLARVTAKTRIVYICSPNNPTGTYTTAANLERLYSALPKAVLLIVDAAYAEFADAPDYDSGLSLFRPDGRVAVTRTFSKAYGLAGLRIGYAVAPDAVIDAVSRLRTPFNASTAAMAAATAAVEDQGHLRAAVARIRRTRAEFTATLQDLGLTVVPSQANFVLIDLRDHWGNACALDEALQNAGILGRPVAAGTSQEYRITIGTEDEMRKTAAAIRAWLDQGRTDAAR